MIIILVSVLSCVIYIQSTVVSYNCDKIWNQQKEYFERQTIEYFETIRSSTFQKEYLDYF